MSNIQFDTPANRIIAQQQPKNKFRIDTSLPDVAFLRQLSIQGRLRYFQEELTDIIFTPANGETFFFLRANARNTDAGGTRRFTIINAGMIRESFNLPANSVSSVEYISNMKMDSLVGDGIKTFECQGQTDDLDMTMWGWVENTSRIRDVTS